jgi:threonine/homoserine/homoserine lactone efflux protein
MIKIILLFFLGFGLGFLAAIPVGGSQIEAAKRAIHGHLLAAWMVVLGSVSSDIFYGVISLFGIAPFLEIPWVMAAFNAVGVIVLWTLSFLTIRESRKPHEVRLEQSSLSSKRRAYLTGFTLAVTNPPMILTWLYGITLAKHLGLASPFTTVTKILFIAGGALGLGTYLGVLTAIMHRIKHFIPLKTLGKVYFWLGVGLFLLSFFFIYNIVRYFHNAG